jgi:hypothetical protein
MVTGEAVALRNHLDVGGVRKLGDEGLAGFLDVDLVMATGAVGLVGEEVVVRLGGTFRSGVAPLARVDLGQMVLMGKGALGLGGRGERKGDDR